MTELTRRRRALMGILEQGGSDVITGTVTANSSHQIIVPAKAGQNFIAIHDEPSGTTMSGGEVVELYRLKLLSADRVYTVKDANTTATPPTMGIATVATAFVTQNANDIAITCNNANGAGFATEGRRYRYFIWEETA